MLRFAVADIKHKILGNTFQKIEFQNFTLNFKTFSMINTQLLLLIPWLKTIFISFDFKTNSIQKTNLK